MSKTIRYTLLSLLDLAASFGPFIVLGIAMLAFAYWWPNPNPPKHLTLATGRAQSAYDEFGTPCAKILAQDGIDVVLLPSEGSAQNLQLLRAGKADLGFVQGGASEANAEDTQNLESLGSLFVKPIWLFYRDDGPARSANSAAALDALPQLKGLRVNVGTAGSGIPRLMNKLMKSNNVELSSLQISVLQESPATMAFHEGKLDAIVFALAPESLMVQMLLQTPGVRLMDIPHNEAYSRRFAFLGPVLLPRGVVDLAGNIPPQDMRLVAPTTALIVRNGTHPVLLQLFVQAGKQIHGNAGWFRNCRLPPKPNAASETTSRFFSSICRFGSPIWWSNVAGHGHHPGRHAAAVTRLSAALRVSGAVADFSLVCPAARN